MLTVTDLEVQFISENRIFQAVDRIGFTIQAGETVCLVGESGCGKSVTGLALLRLIEEPGKITNGVIRFQNIDVLGLDSVGIRNIRGRKMAMIFQEPMTSLNPVLRIRDQLAEAFEIPASLPVLVGLMQEVGLDEGTLDCYPHMLSGGQRQRVMIAMALANNPSLLIADEPTTALDVTVQAQILDLLKKLQKEHQMSVLLITHDFGVVEEMADRVLVMYAGQIIEEGGRAELLGHSRHPYTRGLLKAVPHLNSPIGPLPTIEGHVPNSSEYPRGCRFHPRCTWMTDKCRTEEPPITEIAPGHTVSCWEHERVTVQ